jgi:hypothetical protein
MRTIKDDPFNPPAPVYEQLRQCCRRFPAMADGLGREEGVAYAISLCC